MNELIPATTSANARPKRVKDLTGRVFGLLTVERYDGLNPAGKAMWACKCWCGKETTVVGYSLSNGDSKSCGCLRDRIVSQNSTRHGQAGTDIYWIWRGIKKRTESEGYSQFKKYGAIGRGLSKEWSESFETFAKEIGPRPSKKHTIDRINNLLGYSKENCRWATYTEQARNRTSNRILEWRGEKLPLCVLAERYGMTDQVLGRRLRKGMTLELALTTPVRCYKKAPHQLRYEAEDLLTG